MKSVYLIHSIDNYSKFSKSAFNMLNLAPNQSGKLIDNHLNAIENSDLTIAINYESSKIMDKINILTNV